MKLPGVIVAKSLRIGLLLLVFSFLLLPPVGATTTEGVAAQSDFSPPLGVYHYKVKWGVISAGRASVSFSKEGDSYLVVAEARAVGGVDKIYKLRYRGESEIDADDLSPIRTVLTSQEGQRNKEKVIDYQEDGQLTTTHINSRKGQKPQTHQEKREFNNQVFDPFSAILLARQMEWREGLAQEFEIFTGSTRYLVELNAIGRRMIEAAGVLQEAWAIVPTIENLSNPEKGSKVESAVIYLATGKERELLKLESKVFVGKVQVTLDRFEPLLEPVESTQKSPAPVIK